MSSSGLGLGRRDGEPGDAAVGKRPVAFAHAARAAPPARPHRRSRPAPRRGFVLPARQVQLLDALGGVGVSALDHHGLVEVLGAVPHAAHVEGYPRLEGGESGPDVGGEHDGRHWLDLEVAERLAAPGSAQALLDPCQELLHARRGEAEGEPSVGDLGGELDVGLGAGAEPDGQARVHVQDGRQRLAEPRRSGPGVGQGDLLSFVPHRRLAREHLAHDGDVVPEPPVGPPPRLPVPALDDLGSRDTEAGDHPAAPGEGVEGAHGHRGRRRGPRRELHDAGAEPDASGERGEIGQGRDGVRPVSLGRPHRIEPQPLGLEDLLHGQMELGTGITNAQSELHHDLLLAPFVPTGAPSRCLGGSGALRPTSGRRPDHPGSVPAAAATKTCCAKRVGHRKPASKSAGGGRRQAAAAVACAAAAQSSAKGLGETPRVAPHVRHQHRVDRGRDGQRLVVADDAVDILSVGRRRRCRGRGRQPWTTCTASAAMARRSS